jgi:uncharacterized protein (TIGR00369 family)
VSLADVIAKPDLEALRQRLRGRAEGGIVSTLGFDLVALGDGVAVFAGTPDRRAYNPIGSVHGGYAATMLDSACGCAVHTKLVEGEGYTTLELKVAYHRAMTETTGEVRAEGRVVTIGRRTAFAEATLKDAAGRLYASATSTLLVIRP